MEYYWIESLSAVRFRSNFLDTRSFLTYDFFAMPLYTYVHTYTYMDVCCTQAGFRIKVYHVIKPLATIASSLLYDRVSRSIPSQHARMVNLYTLIHQNILNKLLTGRDVARHGSQHETC